MKRFVPLFILLLLTLPKAQAQFYEDTRVKVFAGYTILPTSNYDFGAFATEKQGFTGSAALRLVGGLSAKFDFTNVNAPGNAKLFLVGPEYRFHRSDHFEVFAHTLFGVMTTRSKIIFEQDEYGGVDHASNTSFAFVAGAGADVYLNRHIGLRLVQFDYVHSSDQVTTLASSGYRASAGLVVKF